MNEVLVAKELGKRFTGALNVEVFSKVNLTVHLGEKLAIVGASGIGKSTLIHLLGGLDQPSEGEVWLRGNCLTTATETQKAQWRNQYLGFIYQFHHLLPEFTAVENVAMPLWIRGLDREASVKKAKELLGLMGLSARVTHLPGELSGGECQRVALARALITDPVCVLGDEVTGNLDPNTAEKVFGLLLELSQHFLTSYVLVTHDERLAKRMDRILTLQNGRLMECSC